MAICNRDLDVSQQKTSLRANVAALGTGLTLPVVIIDSPANIVSAKVAAFGISGTPTALLSIQRFIVGSGVTSFLGGFTTLTMQAAGTSGVQSVVTAAAGSTALNLLAGDVIMVTSGGSNAAVTGLAVDLVIQYTQDIKTYFGS
jgi:hypothetical protein